MNGQAPTPTMKAGERRELLSLAKQRAKVEQAVVKQRSAEILAEFEELLDTIYPSASDPVWKSQHEAAEAAVREANERVRERSAELGIPPEFAPSITLHLWRPGGRQLLEEHHARMRKVIKAKLDAAEKAARATIENRVVEVQTKLVADGLTTEAAQRFLEEMPSARQLMAPVESEMRRLLPGVESGEETEP